MVTESHHPLLVGGVVGPRVGRPLGPLSVPLRVPLGVPMGPTAVAPLTPPPPPLLPGRREHREDPMSHRIIEKRRRDRMNNCLADLSRLIPAEYLKKGRGRVEKTEIIEMAIKHMQYLQNRANLAAGLDCGPGDLSLRVTKSEQSPSSDREAAATPVCETVPASPSAEPTLRPVVRPIVTEHYRLGYQECLSEAMHFLVEVEGYFAGDSLCVKLISHLQKHCDRIVKDDRLNFPRSRQPGEATSSSGSSSSYGANGSGGPKATSLAATLGSAGSEEQPPTGMASQLRDILCSSPPQQYQTLVPHYDAHPEGPDGGPDGEPAADAHQPYPEGAVVGASRHLETFEPSEHAHHHSYKFKNNIKQRFSEEHAVHIGQKRRRLTSCTSPTPSQSHRESHPPSSQQASVPIFVLHAKGAFYIPLTVSYEVLAPYLDIDLLSDAGSARSATTVALTGSSAPSGVVLHPVTISVNFQQYLKPQPPPGPPSVVPPQTTPTHPWSRSDIGNGLPMPSAWEVCASGPNRQ